MIKISEIFGPVIQGEGMHIGVPTVFVRSGGCDYRCSWCDTMYAVDKKFAGDWISMSNEEVEKEIYRHSPKPILVTLSGGNPALFDFSGVITAVQEHGYTVTVETQGSIPRFWFGLLNTMTVSPKPPSSGMQTNLFKLDKCMAFLPPERIALKIVVADDWDYAYAELVSGRFPQVKTFLQVCNPDPKSVMNRVVLLDKLDWLSQKVLQDKWFNVTVLPQLHVLLYGNKRGV